MFWTTLFGISEYPQSAFADGKIPGLDGRQPGFVKVDNNGAATYTIPIIAPPGTNGVQPNLAFAYSSQGGNGLLGMGWSISGLPVIDRCAKTIAQDGIVGGINLDANDRFCMDGARLMAVGNVNGGPGTYGANGTEYHTEVDKFVRIVSYGVTGDGPQYFIAQTKDGITMEFGNSTSSAILAENLNKNVVRVWALNKLSDRKGNYLTITYENIRAEGYYRPARIDYTSNASGLTAHRSVRFTAVSRTDVWPMYVGGSLVKTNELITHVTTYLDETPIRDYALQYEYGTSTKRSRLKSIQECSGASCMPAHVFDWQEGGSGSYTPVSFNYPNGNFSSNYVWIGDYNGDGKMDLATAADGHLYTYLSNGNGTYSLQTPFDYPNGKFNAPHVWPGDYNGDGCTDLATAESGKLYTYLSNCNGFNGTYTLAQSLGYNYPNGNFTIGYVWTGDYNGDGRIDLATTENGKLYTYFSNGDGTYTELPSGGYDYPNGNFSPGYVWPGDYDGDGRTDLATAENGKLYTYLSSGDGTYRKIPETGFDYPNGNFTPGHVWAGDFNGDGKTDLATAEGGILYTYFSKGDGNYKKADFDFPNSNFEANYVWAVDYNGDGKSDLASRENGILYTYFSLGDGRYEKVPYDFVNSQFTADKVWAADYKGYGKSDWASSAGGVLYTYLSDGPYPDLMTRVTNPFQGKNDITYKSITDASVYAKEDQAQYLGSYPNIDIQVATYVVSNLTVSDSDNTYPYAYSYRGAKINLLGRGWLGYRVMETFDTSAQATNIVYSNQLFPLTGLASNQETKKANGDFVVDIVNTYAVSDPSFPNSNHGVKRVLLNRIETEELDGQASGRLTGKNFTYDNYGNLRITVHEGIVNSSGDEYEEETEWATDGTNWLFKPKTQILRQGTGAGGVVQRQKWLFYDGNNSSHGTLGSFGLVTKEEIRLDPNNNAPGSASNAVFLYDYDAFGNRTTATDPRNCTTTTAFDTTNRTYPTSVRACSNLSSPNFETTYEYFPEHGGIKTKTDPNLAVTRFEYDEFGRPKKVTNHIDYQQGSPNGTESYSYLQWGTVDAQRVVISKTVEHGQSGVLKTEHYFDGFGRVDLTSSDGPTGSPILSQTVYDSRGLVVQKSTPRFASEALKWETITYDARGRDTQVLHADGTSVTKLYAPGQVTITDERGKVKINLLDAHGRLSQVQEKNASQTYTTNYTYDAAGALKTVTNQLNHVTTMNYDVGGRKTSMQDPNMGTWSYTYTRAGDLDSQTDAKNQTLCFQYDALGRSVLKKQGQTQNCLLTVANLFEWTYDDPAVPFSKGRVTKILDKVTNAESRILAYDALGRTTQTRRVIDGQNYELTQIYDALNRVKSETFPDSDTITYMYNSAGWLGSVPGYVNSISYNARAQRTAVVYANGITSGFTYDDTDATPSYRLTHRLTTFNGGTHNVNALTSWVRSWTTSPGSFVSLYRGGVCVANGSGTCVGGDSLLESGVGGAIGYLSTSGGVGTVPVYRSTCYLLSGGCSGWGLSLDVNGSPVGYLATAAPDVPSSSAPFIQSNGLLLQGLSGAPSAYLWTSTPPAANHTAHLYLAPGPAPDGYTSDGTTGYIDQAANAGTTPLYRFVNSATNHYYYSIVSDAPSGFSSDGVLGYIHTIGGSGLTALYRHFNSTTGDYLLSTSAGSPSGYQFQATLGYIHTGAGSTSVYQDLNYTYDNGGNVNTVTDMLWTGSREFAYDDLNRLTQATGNFGPSLAEVTHNYAYDPIGNVLSKANVLFYYCNHPTQPAAPQNCTGAIHPSAVAATSDGRTYTYDANGNTLSGAGRSFIWNVENRLQDLSAPGGSVGSVYDHTGTRIKKTASGSTTYFPFAGYEIEGSIVKKYIRVGNETLAAKIGGDIRFYHNDHQGGVNLITDMFAGIVQLDEYDPWGKVSRSEGNAEKTRRFNGKELDAESGLYYYGARYYDPDLARFVSPDTFVQEPANPQNLNRYSYTINNPQKYVDPSGHFFGLIFSLIFKASIAAKLTAATDPWGFLLSKIPKKVNAGFTIFGGVAMMLSGNPMGAVYVTQGGLGFAKGNGAQIASQLLGSTAASVAGGTTEPGNDYAWGSQIRFGGDYRVHQEATRRAIGRFGDLTPQQIGIINSANDLIDSTQYQRGQWSYLHAMRNSDQLVVDASQLANDFVRGKFELAWFYRAEGDMNRSLFEFGLGLHTLQDSTSPSHIGFQVWTGLESLPQELSHVWPERLYPGDNSALFRITERAYRWYRNGTLPAGDLFAPFRAQ